MIASEARKNLGVTGKHKRQDPPHPQKKFIPTVNVSIYLLLFLFSDTTESRTNVKKPSAVRFQIRQAKLKTCYRDSLDIHYTTIGRGLL